MKVKFYDKELWKDYAAKIAFISSVVTIISFFFTLSDCIKNICMILFILAMMCIFLYMWWSANHKDKCNFVINNTRVEIVIGNIFEQLDNPDKHPKEVSVIAFNNYYDIIDDNRIVAKKSLHGQYIKRIREKGKLKAFNNRIKEDEVLKKLGNPQKEPNRPAGRKWRYDIGSLFEYEDYILTAFTMFDKNNIASLSADEYMHFWMNIWNNIDYVYAGRTINIPLMGAGISRFRNGKPTKQQLLEIMLWSLKISGFHNTYGDSCIRFIIYEADEEEINFYRLQKMF